MPLVQHMNATMLAQQTMRAPIQSRRDEVAMLSQTELEAAIKLANAPPKQEATMKPAESQAHLLSQKLLAQRAIKQQQQAILAAEEESKQQTLDAAEAEYQAQQRAKIVERANRLLFADRDAVKNLETGVKLSRVIKEREAQIVEKQQRIDKERKDSAQFHEKSLTSLRIANEQAASALVKQREAQLELAKSQKSQLSQYKARQNEILLREVNEGERARQIEAAVAAELRESEVQRTKEMRKMAKDYMTANDDLLKRRAELALAEQAEEAKIRRYAAEKEATEATRLAEAQAKIQAANTTKNVIASQVYSQLQQIREKEHTRLNAQIAEQEMKTEAALEQQKQMREARKKDMLISRTQQIQKHKQQQQQQKQEDAAFSRKVDSDIKLSIAEQERQLQLRRDKAREVLAAQREQVRERTVNWINKTEVEATEQQLAVQARVREDEEFTTYADGRIRQLEEEGCNPLPAKLAMRTRHH